MNMSTVSRQGKTWIGTSGLVLPGPKHTFPEDFQSSSRLHYYSSLFNSIEINSTFYKLHKPATFQRWSHDVPQEFTFTVKLWKEVTHKKNLEYKEDDLGSFVSTLDFSDSNKGCLLIQFPASIHSDMIDRVEQILSTLHDLMENQRWHLCVEFRHRSWYEQNVLSMLRLYNASLVYHDMPRSFPTHDVEKSEIVYLRFHGPDDGYRGAYTREFLDEYAQYIHDWNSMGKDVYAYFNNTLGSAFDNARYLYRKMEYW